MFFILRLILIIAEGVWQLNINYPPSLQQLNIGVNNFATLWLTKILSLGLLIISTYFFSNGLEIRIKKYYWIFILAVPSFSLIWMSYPVDAVKIFIISCIYFSLSRKRVNLKLGIIFGIIGVVLLNIFLFKEKPEILKVISLSQPRQEVNFHYQIENNLKPNIPIPAVLKKLVYNKIFFAFRDGINSSIYFIDTETLFFQEVHPLGQKAFVMFFWPEVFIFILGVWLTLTKQIRFIPQEFLLIVLAFTYFITTDSSPERRLILALFPIAIILSKSAWSTFNSGSKAMKTAVSVLLFLTCYGWMTNYFDRTIRPTFWLDNRPFVYNFILSNIKTVNKDYDRIIVPNTLFALNKYCTYYIKECPVFTYDDFDLLKQPILKNTVYIGFVGNYLGKNSDNSFPLNPENEITGRGLEILYKSSVPDNIANGYGQTLLITRSKK